MSTRFGILKPQFAVEKETDVIEEICDVVAVRHNGGRIEFKTDTSQMPDNLPVYPLNNSRQGVQTIGDLRHISLTQGNYTADELRVKLTWQQKEEARYLTQLEERWTKNGKLKILGDVLPSGSHERRMFNPDMVHSTSRWISTESTEQGWWIKEKQND